MVEQLLKEAEQETWPAPREGKYLRLIEGKVILVSEAEAMSERVLIKPRILTDQDILVLEWNDRVKRVEQLKERISLIHKMMQGDDQRPSQYETAYNTLWGQYREAIESLREIDPETVSQFRDKVAARVEELEVRISNLCGAWDPDYFNYFERTLACYEKNYDLMLALQPRLPDQALALGHEG